MYAPLPFSSLDISLATKESPSVEEITDAVTSSDQIMIDADLEKGLYMDCTFMYRGTVSTEETKHAIAKIRSEKKVPLVEWNPSGIKVGINKKENAVLPDAPMSAPQSSVTMLAGSSVFSQVIHRLNEKFDLMIGKRAFVHWYMGEVLLL